MKIAILGGGPTGVACARTLVDRGYEPHVFEAEARIGGLCRSEVHDGYVHDLSGGHILHSRDQQVLADLRAELGPEETVTCERDTKIFYRGAWVKYPFENGLADLPANDRFDCVKGYIDAYIARKDGAEQPRNFRDWISWRMGDGIAEHFMFPYNEKLWTSDLRDVSTSWVAGRVPEAPYEDVLKSALGISTEGYKHQIDFYYPRTGGFETLIQRMADPIRDRVRVSTPVSEVVRTDRGWEINGEAFDAAINSIPLQELFRTLRPGAPEAVQAAVDSLRYLSIATVLLGIDRAELSPLSWVYLPHPENGPSNRITFLNNYSPENAPPGKSSILAEVTFPGGELPACLEATEKEVVAAMVSNGFVGDDEIELVRSYGFRYAYPYYDVDFQPRMDTIRQHLDGLDLHTLGRFGAYRYVNTDQVMIMVREFFADHFPAQ